MAKVASKKKDKPSGIVALQQALISKLRSKKKCAGDIIDLSDDAPDIDFIPTGCWILDHTISNRRDKGGFPEARMIDVAGEFSSGKSVLTGTFVAGAQSVGGLGYIVDSELSFDKNFGIKVLGLIADQTIVHQENTTEIVFSDMEDAIDFYKDSGVTAAMVVDSLATLSSQDIKKKGIDDGITANSLSDAHKLGFLLKRMNEKLKQSKICVVFVNQARDNIATGPAAWSAEKKRSSAGNALKHLTSVAIWLKYIGRITDSKKNVVGVWVEFILKKNNVGPQFRKGWFPIYFNKGIDNCLAELKYMEKRELFKKTGQKIKFKNQEVIRNVILDDLVVDVEVLANVVHDVGEAIAAESKDEKV